MYKPIADYGIIGDLHSVALINQQGGIDWLCLPDFDSSSVFLRLLDDQHGGSCDLTISSLQSAGRRYLPGTNILETTFQTQTGVLRLIDFMPVAAFEDGKQVSCFPESRVVRILTCTTGSVSGSLWVQPSFNYARCRGSLSVQTQSIDGPSETVLLSSNLPLRADGEDQAVFDFDLCAGEKCFLAIGHSTNVAVSGGKVSLLEAEARLAQTKDYWERWSARCRWEGEYREQVLRSVLCLKLLTYAPTGGIVAAPTFGLPEQIGGERNWDYRYAWMRDASFTISALTNLGFTYEATSFLEFLMKADRTEGRELKIAYGLKGPIPRETRLDHLPSYRQSRPVLVGNNAQDQQQYDIYGEFLSAVRLYLRRAGDGAPEWIRKKLPVYVTNLADCVIANWKKPDRGIWELRTGDQHLLHTKAMCWLALHCAVEIAQMLGFDADTARWEACRDQIRAEYHERAFDPKQGAFTQGYNISALDASVMRVVLFDAIDAQDPRLQSTLKVIEQKLERNGLIYRYRADDGFPPGEGAFTVCAFWLAGCEAISGQTKRAKERFDYLLTLGNDLGLYAEEIDPDTKEHLGNFPQGFTHMSIVNGLVRLQQSMEKFGLR
jgi:GH15 family glucan-1,4-alpha-glucosidase